MAFQIKPVQKIDNLEDLKKKYRAGDKITESQKRKMRKAHFRGPNQLYRAKIMADYGINLDKYKRFYRT